MYKYIPKRMEMYTDERKANGAEPNRIEQNRTQAILQTTHLFGKTNDIFSASFRRLSSSRCTEGGLKYFGKSFMLCWLSFSHRIAGKPLTDWKFNKTLWNCSISLCQNIDMNSKRWFAKWQFKSPVEMNTTLIIKCVSCKPYIVRIISYTYTH